jgi:hypothetical protein
VSERKLPKWARHLKNVSEIADTDCTTGLQPDFAPRLSIRVIPVSQRSTLSASTLRDVIDQTQRIVTYAAYEVVNGIHLDFSDLRQVDSKIVEFATLMVEPFEEGSFVIPTAMKDAPTKIKGEDQERDFTCNEVIKRFTDAFEEVTENAERTSIGLVQSIENLGTILKREAERIEYSPIGIPGETVRHDAIVVDSTFVRRVSAARKKRMDPKSAPDALTGTLIAVDLAKATFKLEFESRRTIRGTFSPFMADVMAQSLRKRIIVEGVVEYVGRTPKHIRASFASQVDE